MRRTTAAVVPKRTHSEPRSRASTRTNPFPQNANGMMSYSSLAMVLGVVALTTAPMHPAIPRILSKLTNPVRHNDLTRPLGGEKRFLLGIFSSVDPADTSRRESIRQQYLDIGDPRICSLQEFMRQTDENPYQRVCEVPYTFVIGGGGDHRPTKHDDGEPLTVDTDHNGHFDPEGDCTYLNIRENEKEGKSGSWFKYASMIANEYSIDYIAKVDDGSILLPELFFKFLDDLPNAPFNQHLYGGIAQPSYTHNILYGTGEFYFMSTDLAHFVGNTMYVLGTDRAEDADVIGAVVSSSPRPVKFVDLNGFQFWSSPSKHPWDFSGNNKKTSDTSSWWSNCPKVDVTTMAALSQ